MSGPLKINLADHDGDHWLRAPKKARPSKATKQLAEQVAKEWDESQHPRADDGKWSEGGGGTAVAEPPIIGARGAVSQTWTHPVPVDFIAARDRSTRRGFLAPLALEDMAGKRTYLSDDGTVGFALTREGDFENLFNNGGPKGSGPKAIADGIALGATTLDCYDGHLPNLYAQMGFVETGRMSFNPDFAPPGWDHGTYDSPDVVFMAWQGYPNGEEPQHAITRAQAGPKQWISHAAATTRYSGEQWDAAKAASRRASRA